MPRAILFKRALNFQEKAILILNQYIKALPEGAQPNSAEINQDIASKLQPLREQGNEMLGKVISIEQKVQEILFSGEILGEDATTVDRLREAIPKKFSKNLHTAQSAIEIDARIDPILAAPTTPSHKIGWGESLVGRQDKDGPKQKGLQAAESPVTKNDRRRSSHGG